MKQLDEKAARTSERVLARRGARELTVIEMDTVSGGGPPIHTNVASLAHLTTTHTGAGDNDGGGDTDVTY